MTKPSTFTATNLDSYVGDTVSIEGGNFSVSPWGYKMPTTSSRFGLEAVPSGVYMITKKTPESQADGAAVQYELTIKA